MSSPDQAESPHSRLAHFPVTFFATGMGMMGFTLALRAAETSFALKHWASGAVLALAAAGLLAVLLAYALKLLRHRAQVEAEWRHPVRIAFFPAISISLLLLSVALLDVAPRLAEVIWVGATLLQGALALSVISAWIGHRLLQPAQLSPAWFIPAVGNVIVPLAGAKLGYMNVSWLFFSGGLIFWVVLLTLVINRLMFHDPLPGRMVPTLMILVAPPAVAFTAWLRLAGEPGPFGLFLLNAAYVFALVVTTQLGKFRSVPFALSWWALSFPLAALTIASFGYAHAGQSETHQLIGVALLALLAVVMAGLVLRTAIAMARGQICVPE